MKSVTKNFLVLVFVLTVICAGLQWVWNNQMRGKMHLYDGPGLLAFFSGSVVVVHVVLLAATKDSGNAFIRAFMASMVIKFFLYIAVLMLCLLYSKDNKQTLVIHFLFYYFIFNALEVSMLYKEARKKST